MLRLVLGRAGSGKTHFARQKVSEICKKDDGMAIILVPEQYSFETERALLKNNLLTNSENADVLSFSSLCRRIFEEYGGCAKPPITGGARAILMGLALLECADTLSLYKKSALSPDLVKSMLDISAEFKQCAVSVDDLSSVSAALPNGALKRKTAELSTVISVYEALVTNIFSDDQTNLEKILILPQTAEYFRKKTVVIDGFKGFTAVQLKMIELIVKNANDVYITLCADSLQSDESPIGLFNNVKLTANSIIASAQKNGVPVASPIILNKNLRAKNKTLLLIEERLSLCESTEVNKSERNDDLIICECNTPHEETDYIARTICKIVRENGVRYRDIAVIARSIGDYSGVVRGAFSKYALPYHMDIRRPINHEPSVLFLQNAFSAVLGGFDTDDIFAALKTELTPLSRDDIALLENYTFLWGIAGARFVEEFTNNPDGVCDGFTEKQKETLARINKIRQAVITPFSALSGTLNRSQNGGEITKALYNFLQQCEVEERLKRLSELVKNEGRHDDADSIVRSYNIVCDVLQQMFDATEKRNISLKKYAELLSLAFKNSDMGQVPQGLDEIMVGSADRMRPAEPKIVFLLGVNDGVFPLSPSSGGLLTDGERKKLIALGLELSDRCEDKLNDESFLFYSSVCAASEKVYITYCRASSAGESKSPSLPVSELLACFGNDILVFEDDYLKSYGISAFERAQAFLPAVETAARLLKSDSVSSAAAKVYLEKYVGGKKYAALNNALYPQNDKLTKATSETLFGSEMRISPSGVEVFYKCRFWYFCRYGLRVKPSETVDLNVMLKGTIVHYVLEQLFNKYNKHSLSEVPEELLKSEIHDLVYSYVNAYMGGFTEKSARFLATLTRIERQLFEVIDRMARELSLCSFEVAACEKRIGMSEDSVKPMVYTLSNDSKLWVEGVVDRIDVYNDGENCYFRIIDYKTGKKEFLIDEILFGLGLQMLIYMYSIESGGKELFGNSLLPSGILYVPAKSFSVRQDEISDDDGLSEKLDKEAKMSGIILEDEKVINAMSIGHQNVFIPFSFNKDGSLRNSSSVASKEFFSKTKDKISELLISMGELLQGGDIAADPLDPLKGDACQYCEYSSVCPHSGNTEHRSVYKLSSEQKKQIMMGGDLNYGV